MAGRFWYIGGSLFGMMDITVYAEKAYNKLKVYATHGIIPSVNVITTFETKNHPIDSEEIRRIVSGFV